MSEPWEEDLVDSGKVEEIRCQASIHARGRDWMVSGIVTYHRKNETWSAEVEEITDQDGGECLFFETIEETAGDALIDEASR